MFIVGMYIGMVVLIIMGLLFAFWKYKKLEKLVEGNRKDLTDCQCNIDAINVQLNTFRDTIQRIDAQITDLKTEVSIKAKTKSVKGVKGEKVLKNKE